MTDHSATNHVPGIIAEAELIDDAQLIADLADDISRDRAAGWRLRHIVTVASFYSADLDASAGDLPPGRKWTAAENVDAIGQLALELVYWEPDPTTTFVDIRTLALDTLDLVEPGWRDDYVCPQCAAEEAEGKADAAEVWAEEAEQWAVEVEMMADAGETEGVGPPGIFGVHPGLENLAAKIGRPTSVASIRAEHWGWADPRPTLPAPLDQWGRDHLDREVRDGLDLDRYDDLRYAMQSAAEEGRPGETVEHAAEIAYLAREVMDGGPAEPRLDRIMELAVTALSWLAAREKREGLA